MSVWKCALSPEECPCVCCQLWRCENERDDAKAHEDKAYESRAYWCVEAGKAMKERDEARAIARELLDIARACGFAGAYELIRENRWLAAAEPDAGAGEGREG